MPTASALAAVAHRLAALTQDFQWDAKELLEMGLTTQMLEKLDRIALKMEAEVTVMQISCDNNRLCG